MSYPQDQTPPPPYYPAPPAPFAPLQSDPSTPLDQPYYGIPFFAGWKRYWLKYAVFSGRASRSEFWFALLGNAIIAAVFYAVLMVAGIETGIFENTSSGLEASGFAPIAVTVVFSIIGLVFLVFWLGAIIPGIAMYWRRLHDANLPGPLALLVLVPSLGGIWGIVIGCLPTNPAGAQFDRR